MTADGIEPSRAAPGPDDLLLVGDMHLGRRPVGLDDVLRDNGLSPHDLSPASALANVVAHALKHPPRAVIFAGDLVDQDKDRFEAYGVLEREVRRLSERGVLVLAVAGNHDSLVLPRLARRVRGVQLLGEGGVWQRFELPGSGRPVDLLGWSFPTRHVRACPLDAPSFESARASRRPDATAVGVLHADLDASPSPYAPVPRTRLEAAGLDAWFLGHVHKPADLGGPRPLGYLGSLVGLDAGEHGLRGPWRVRCVEDGVRAVQLPIAPLRWASVEIALTDGDADDADALHARMERDVLAALRADPTLQHVRLRAIVARVRFTGRLSELRELRDFVAQHEPARAVFHLHDVPVIVERLHDETRSAVDLDVLAAEPSPVGFVARRLLALRAEGSSEIIARARDVVDQVVGRDWEVDDERFAPPDVAEAYERAAWRLLDVLLQQRAGSES